MTALTQTKANVKKEEERGKKEEKEGKEREKEELPEN